MSTTITGLPNATTPLSGTERVPMDQAGATKDASTQDIANLAPGTDLTYTAATRTLASSTGDDVVLPEATTTDAGLQSAADKTRIDQLGADDSPTFAGATFTGLVTANHIHGNIAGSVYFHVKNTSGGELTKGTPIRVTGAVGDTTTLQIAAADAASSATMPAVGILDATLAVNAEGHAVIVGEVTALNTGSFTAGQTLYVASGGGLTATRPASNAQAVAIVGRVQSETGTIAVTLDAVLGGAAVLNVGTTAGTVAAGDDARFHDAVTLGASVADVLDLTGQVIGADDPGADRILFWDDSEGKLRHLQLGGGLVIDGTTLTLPVEIGLACSDETTALTTGAAKVTFRMPYAMTLTAVRASVTTAPTGSTLVVDINEGGTSVLSTKLSIDAGEKTSTTAAVPAVISDSSLADDAEITIDIDQIGATVAGAGLKVWLIGRRA